MQRSLFSINSKNIIRGYLHMATKFRCSVLGKVLSSEIFAKFSAIVLTQFAAKI